MRGPWGGPAAGARGFSYLGLLFFVAITAAPLAAAGQAWGMAGERERQRELEFRGNEIGRAITTYSRALSADPTVPPQFPTSFDDLLNDRRGIKTRHHLRRAYLDPFTGKPDWVLVPEPTNPKRFNAVHSSAAQVLLRESKDDGTAIRLASDWVFAARPIGSSEDAPGNGSAAPGAASAARP
ncbi:MAG: hypothetical protein H7242_15910 [Microbacteriaceae bacterium]|nr:hypothetical protein [Burkholderiaceae bacterium]